MSTPWRCIFVAILVAFALPAHALNQWQDDQGQAWTLPERLPTRWIVLGPHLVDMLTAIGASERIVGVQDDHPIPGRYEISLSGHAVVGQSGSISEERVRALRPDLVVFWPTGLSPVQQQRLQRLGIPLLAIAPKRLDDIPQRLRWLGALSGYTQSAKLLAYKETAALNTTREQYARGLRLRGFYQVWQQPLYSLSRHHLVSQAMAICGVDSIVPPGTIEAPVLNTEAVLRARTNIILVGHDELAQAQVFWRRFSTLPAVRQNAIVGVDDYALTRPGLSLLRAIPTLCKAVSPWRIRQSMPESE
ncbi:MAG: ABC transporter substrate-binding protein [Paraperlucidibaca sp.]